MKILIVEPYLAGSHAAWAREYAAASSHDVEILSLPGRHWKWRMHGGAVTLARMFLERGCRPDLVLATDMLDLTTFLALARRASAAAPGAAAAAAVPESTTDDAAPEAVAASAPEATATTAPASIYFHENQLSYPWSSQDDDPALGRDAHYGFINYASALAAEVVLFNSRYHLESFLGALPEFLAAFPDFHEPASIDAIAAKSSVLPLGLDLADLDRHRAAGRAAGDPQAAPLVLWNHRWEYDKNPDEFFRALFVLADEGLPFEVAVLGEAFERRPPVFDRASERLGERIVQFGYVKNPDEYARWLWRADILPVTSDHDFFGASAVQAIYCGCRPLLPRRLAFPEHIPPELHGACLYDGFEDLVGRLRALLSAPLEPAPPELRQHVGRYDWSALADVYDRICSALVDGY